MANAAYVAPRAGTLVKRPEAGVTRPVVARNGMAYGVDPRRAQAYSLRQARYYEIVLDLLKRFPDEFQGPFQSPSPRRKLSLLDIGVQSGTLKRYLDLIDRGAIDYHGADRIAHPDLFDRESWTLHLGDFQNGYPEIPDNAFDIVVCEQVIEHLHDYETAIMAIERVVKPGGLVIIGVPIFPFGLHRLRRHLVPALDRLVRRKRPRGHVQAFSRRSFLGELARLTDLEILETRGFRVISGGALRPLENREWWWRWNRAFGRLAPGLCIELQVVAIKQDKIGTNSKTS